jgi:predicted transcriptional regulator YdeE
LYAVARVPRTQEPYYVEIHPTWKRLMAWFESSPYRQAGHQWLEEHLRTDDTPDGEWTIDCYLPIAE